MIEYGIQEIKLTAANLDGSFADFNAAGTRAINLVVVDSFRPDREPDKETNLYVEDCTEPVSAIVERGAQTVTFQTYDLSPEQYIYLMGFVPSLDGYLTEKSNFVLPPQAMRVMTKPVGSFSAKLLEWAFSHVKVKKNGSVGKGGLSCLQLDMKMPAGTGYRERALSASVFAGGMTNAFASDGFDVYTLSTAVSPGPYVLRNAKSGVQFSFDVTQGTTSVCVVCPAHLTPSKIYNMNLGYSFKNLFASQAILIDGDNYAVYYYTAPVPFAGGMKIEVTL